MKTLVAVLFALVSTAVFASPDQCESAVQQSVPAVVKRPAPRIKPKAPAAPVVGPKLHLTPFPVRPFAKPTPLKLSTVFKYNCLTPISIPPGGVDIGGGVPLIGERPRWGEPARVLPSGPMPVWPGSPDDFPPAAYAPPGYVPPAPNELPEPSTIFLMLIGVLFMLKSKINSRSVSI